MSASGQSARLSYSAPGPGAKRGWAGSLAASAFSTPVMRFIRFLSPPLRPVTRRFDACTFMSKRSPRCFSPCTPSSVTVPERTSTPDTLPSTFL